MQESCQTSSKCKFKIWWKNLGNTTATRRPIRAWSEHDVTMKLTCRNHPFAEAQNFTFDMHFVENTAMCAPAISQNFTMLCLPRKVTLQHHQILHLLKKSQIPTSAKISKNTNSVRLPQNWQLRISAAPNQSLFSELLYSRLLHSQLLCSRLRSIFSYSVTLLCLSLSYFIAWLHKSSCIRSLPTKLF